MFENFSDFYALSLVLVHVSDPPLCLKESRVSCSLRNRDHP